MSTSNKAGWIDNFGFGIEAHKLFNQYYGWKACGVYALQTPYFQQSGVKATFNSYLEVNERFFVNFWNSMALKIKENFYFGICSKYKSQNGKKKLFDAHALLMKETKGDDFVMKYYLKKEWRSTCLTFGYDYCKEGSEHTIELNWFRNTLKDAFNDPILFCLITGHKIKLSDKTDLLLYSSSFIKRHTFALKIFHQINEHWTVS